MENYQILYPQKIYPLNCAIDEFKEVCKLGDTLFGFCVLNYNNRKFNLYVVYKDRWKFDVELVNNVKKCCKKQNEEWKDFFGVLKSLKNEALNKSIEYFEKINSDTNKISESLEEFHFHFLNIYQSYPIHSDKYFDGIVYRNLRRRPVRLRYATAEVISDLKDTYDNYPWLDIKLLYEDSEKITSFSCQEYGGNGTDIEYKFLQKTRIRKNLKAFESEHTKAEKLYLYYILPIIAGYSHPDHPDNSEKLYDGMYDNSEFLLKPEHVAPYKYILFIPVYDAPIGKKLYGNFFGNITIPFKSKRKRNKFIKKYIKVIEENLFLLIR